MRQALRSLARSPAVTAITLASLALGIGANTAIFQLIDAVVLRPLPLTRPDELAFVRMRNSSGVKFFDFPNAGISNPVFERLRDSQEAFARFGAVELAASYLVNHGGEARSFPGCIVSGDYFATLGIRPHLGRLIDRSDDTPHCGRMVAVVSHRFWKGELGGDPRAIGRKVELDGRRFEIVGVMPPDFTGLDVGRRDEIAVPLCLDETYPFNSLQRSDTLILTVLGRLKPGWTVERASAHLEALSPAVMAATVAQAPHYTSDDAARYKALRLHAEPATNGVSTLRDRYGTPLRLLLGIAGTVLLIACANLANLLLARATARRHELAVRMAVGASRARIVRELLVESLLLAGAGAVLGLALSRLLGPFLLRFLPARDEIVVDLTPDWRVLAFCAAAATLTCVLFGLAPALRGAGADVGLVLKATGAKTTDGADRIGARRFLVGAQIALSFALLAGALLFARSLRNLTGVDPGFRVQGVTSVSTYLDLNSLETERWHPVRDQILERVRAIPGVDDAAFAALRTLGGGARTGVFWPDGAETRRVDSYLDDVGPGCFRTLGIPLLLGRDFGPADSPGGARVAVVNQEFAQRVFGSQSPIGRRIRTEARPGDSGPRVYEVIGVVGNTKHRTLREPFQPIVFGLDTQDASRGMSLQLVVRSRLPPAGLHAAIVREVVAAAPAAVIWFLSGEEIVPNAVGRERLLATFAAFFGVLAAVLAATGLYGVFAYSVARRRREIGIRMALGADGVRVGRMIFGEAAWLLAGGLAAGIVLALVVGRLAGALLFGLPHWDPLTYAATALLLAAIVALACLPAVRRAGRVDPIVVLREE